MKFLYTRSCSDCFICDSAFSIKLKTSPMPQNTACHPIGQAIEAGVRWVRLPCGYRQRPHVENARAARAAAAQAGQPIQLLLDLPSSRPRTGTMQDLCLAVGDKVLFLDPAATVETPEKRCLARAAARAAGSWPINWLRIIGCGFATAG